MEIKIGDKKKCITILWVGVWYAIVHLQIIIIVFLLPMFCTKGLLGSLTSYRVNPKVFLGESTKKLKVLYEKID